MYAQVFCESLAFGCLVAGGGLVALALYLAPPRLRGRLFPRQRERAVSWGGIEVALLCLTFYALPGLILQLLFQVGFFKWLYGAGFPVESIAKDEDLRRALTDPRVTLWITTLAAPVQALLMIAFLRIARQTQLYQLGVGLHRWRQNAILGYLWWLVVTPAVTVLHVLVELLHKSYSEAEHHPLTRVFVDGPARALSSEWLAIFFVTFVGAPMVEELLFRGVIQSWLTRRSWGGDLAVAVSFIVALAYGYEKIRTGIDLGMTRSGVVKVIDGLSPALFVLAMIPGYMYIERAAWRWLPTPNVARGLYGTALLFALAHAGVWPTPIPLFPLALVWGFLAYRTQSLIGPIVFHSLFDGMAALMLAFLAAWYPHQLESGKDDTTAARRVPSTATVRPVPGTSEPRRTYPSATPVWNRSENAVDVIRPASAPSRNSFAPGDGSLGESIFNPFSIQFTCPKSRARTIGSWPGKQPFAYEIACGVRSTSIARVFSSMSTP